MKLMMWHSSGSLNLSEFSRGANAGGFMKTLSLYSAKISLKTLLMWRILKIMMRWILSYAKSYCVQDVTGPR